MSTGAAERISRPLNNPPTVQTSSFADSDPKGFGLLQRDRAFTTMRTTACSTIAGRASGSTAGRLGRGACSSSNPTDDEIHDNIVTYWVPATAVAASSWSFASRLHSSADEPSPPTAVARITHSRLGRGGVPGQPRRGRAQFVIDFEGGPLEELKELDPVEPVVDASRRGSTTPTRYRCRRPQLAHVLRPVRGRAEPVDLRCFLRLGERTLTETWLYQYIRSNTRAGQHG